MHQKQRDLTCRLSFVMHNLDFKIIFYAAMLATIWSCGDDPIIIPPVINDLESITYNPIPFELDIPDIFISETFNFDGGEITVDGILLGRHLFFDPILSLDSTVSCSSCHMITGSFTDNLAVSPGVNGTLGDRSSMSLLNAGFFKNGLFWDGRSPTLDAQALEPIINELEFNHSFESVESRLKVHNDYPAMFRRAFGILNKSEITAQLASKAIAQFEKSIISGGDSKFDKFLKDEYVFSDEEQLGFDIFFDANDDVVDGECAHCHPSPLFTDQLYKNNGIQEVSSLTDFPDLGRGEVTGFLKDNGTFRVPSLRNIQFSAPYMHDGRFATLADVMVHYNSGGHIADNLNANMRPIMLNEEETNAVLTFLETIIDTSFMHNPAYQNPFN